MAATNVVMSTSGTQACTEERSNQVGKVGSADVNERVSAGAAERGRLRRVRRAAVPLASSHGAIMLAVG